MGDEKKSAPSRGGAKRAVFVPPLDGAESHPRFYPGFPHPMRGSVTRGYGSKVPSGLELVESRCGAVR